MSTYNINFSDPLRAGFQIAPGGFNGPGGASVASALRLYGRGALEWGEAVDENMLRTLENFNGATPPPFALAGQVWFQTKFYWLRTGFTWYRLDPDTPGTWVDIGPTGTNIVSGGVVGTNPTPPLVIGTYWYTGGAPVGNDAFGEPLKPTTLYLYDQYGPPGVAPGWLERTNSTATLAPVNGTDFPERSLLVWDEFGAQWVSPPISIVSNTTPTNPLLGSLWWDTSSDSLFVWDGSAWQTVLIAGAPAGGNLNMNGFNITGLPVLSYPDPSSENAATVRYVNDGVATCLRLDATNGPMTGHLALFGVQTYPDLVNLTRAASTNYVNTAIAAVGTPGGGGFSSVNPGVPKPGDIVTIGTVIWIYDSTTTLRQVFPAQYS